MTTIAQKYTMAKEQYGSIGIDTDKALKKLDDIKLSMQVWQGDDVQGFLNRDALSGGIAVTGNYSGRATTPDELRQDLTKALSLIPGKHKVSLHAIYLDTDDKADLDALEPAHFARWVAWAKEQKLGLDFNPTFFSHPMLKNGFTLASPEAGVREFWIAHGRCARKIAAYLGQESGQVCVNNFWVPDGFKDNPVDRMGPRQRLMESLDAIFAEQYDERFTLDAVESKLFGIGAEAYTVGSHEFYMGYGITRNKLICLDAGHFHPTETISNKLSALALFARGMLLHVSRPVRWDSDHVVIMDDELQEIARELVHHGLLAKTYIGLDYFDATINRVAAWVIGMRNTQKALLKGLLEPFEMLQQLELNGDFTARLAWREELKDFPFAAVWDYHCEQKNVPVGIAWHSEITRYEKSVLANRK